MNGQNAELSSQEKKEIDTLIGEAMLHPNSEFAHDLIQMEPGEYGSSDAEEIFQKIAEKCIQSPEYARRILYLFGRDQRE